MAIFRAVLSLVLLLSALASTAEDPNAVIKPKRPRIAVALDAGGALGLAHVGFLQWMEQQHIPIDYIAGTSMGGLVGGAYATGMSSTDLKELVGGIDWESTVFQAQPEYRDLPFRVKDERHAYPGSVEFGLNHGLRMPTGLNSGENVDRVIARFALPYSTVREFDRLPIPFRCVATDLNSGTMQIFSNGVLGDALRATMSIPAIFEPVKIGDKLYVDGTLLDPLPTDIAREMGGDVVIAVFLESYVPGKQPQSPFGALFRSLEAVTLNNELRNMPKADVLVKVPLLDVTNLEYERWQEIIARGYAAAEANATALKKYSLSDEEWRAYVTQKQQRRRAAPDLQYVKLNGDTGQAETAGLAELGGKPLDVEEVDEKVREIAADGTYARVVPQLTTDGNENAFVLDIRTSNKELGRVTLQPVLLLDGSDYNNVRFAAGGRISMRGAGIRGAELRTDALVGSTFRFSTEYLAPVAGSKHWFTATHFLAENAPMDFYNARGKHAEYRAIQARGGFDVGYTFDRFSELRVGYELGWMKYSNELGPSVMPKQFRGQQSIANLRFIIDHTDDPVLPRRGIGLETLFSYYPRRPASGGSIPSMQMKVQGFQPISETGSFYLIGSAGSTFGETDTGFPLYALGSSMRLASYGANEILTNQYWLAQAGYMHRLMKMPPMTGKNVYLTSGVEIAKPFYTTGVSRLPMDVRLGVIAQTILGPVQVGTAFGDTGYRKFFFQMGRVF